MTKIKNLELNKTYLNRNGLSYTCIGYDENKNSIVESISKYPWICTIVNITIYEDNTIEWDYSKNGYFKRGLFPFF